MVNCALLIIITLVEAIRAYLIAKFLIKLSISLTLTVFFSDNLYDSIIKSLIGRSSRFISSLYTIFVSVLSLLSAAKLKVPFSFLQYSKMSFISAISYCFEKDKNNGTIFSKTSMFLTIIL